MNKWSLSRKLTVFMNILVAIALIAVSATVSFQMTEKFRTNLTQQVDILAEVNASVAGPLVWNLDSTNLKNMVAMVSHKGAVDGLVFLNDKGELVLKDDAKVEDFPNSKFIDKDIKNGADKIGTLRMYYNESQIQDANHAAFATTVVLFILGQLLVTAGIYFLARALNLSISGIVHRLQHATTETGTQSASLHKSSAQLSDATTSQASAIQETTSTLEEMRAMGDTSASHAASSYDRASESYNMTVSARVKMEEMTKYIEKMGKSSEEMQIQMHKTNENMADIVKTITEIKAKTTVINDIVFQTKLLSFNASVEAARAGEHGRGFSVVAEEVGQLATMSGNASKEISTLLDLSLTKVQHLAHETKDRAETIARENKQQMASTEQTSAELNHVFDKIVGNVEQVKMMMSEVSTSIKEHATGVQNIAAAMVSLDQVTQENANAAASSSGNSESLATQAVELQKIVGDLQAEIFGSGSSIHQGVDYTIKDSDKTSNNYASPSPTALSFSKILDRFKTGKRDDEPKDDLAQLLQESSLGTGTPKTKTTNKAKNISAKAEVSTSTKSKSQSNVITMPAKNPDKKPQKSSSKQASPKTPEVNSLKKVSGDTGHHATNADGKKSQSQSTVDGLQVPSKSDKRFEDF